MVDDLDQYAEHAPKPDEQGATRVQELLKLRSEAAENLKAAEEAAKKAKDDLRWFDCEIIPKAWDAAELGDTRLAHRGFYVTVAEHGEGHIAADWEPERREAAFQLLEETGNGHVIKRTLTLRFAKDEAADEYVATWLLTNAEAIIKHVCDGVPMAEALVAQVKNADHEARGLAARMTKERKVDWQTMGKLVRDLLKAGKLTEEMRKAWGVWTGSKVNLRKIPAPKE
jgi:hypothetical protein